jgi:hypothetical protein
MIILTFREKERARTIRKNREAIISINVVGSLELGMKIAKTILVANIIKMFNF